ncbi:hypothetical protein KC338_g173 [Hortaea werneckii]|nr:hypothetical protein KC338_g173 [Hortaea werneckii]
MQSGVCFDFQIQDEVPRDMPIETKHVAPTKCPTRRAPGGLLGSACGWRSHRASSDHMTAQKAALAPALTEDVQGKLDGGGTRPSILQVALLTWHLPTLLKVNRGDLQSKRSSTSRSE